MRFKHSALKVFVVMGLAAILLFVPSASFAQTNINAAPQTLTLSYTQAESLTLALSTNTLAFAINGANLVTPTTNVTLTWNLAAGRATIEASAGISAPLTGATNTIPMSKEFAVVNGVTSSNPCAGAFCTMSGVTGSWSGSPVLYNKHAAGTLNLNSNDSFTLAFQVQGNSFAVDTYTQVVTLSALAN